MSYMRIKVWRRLLHNTTVATSSLRIYIFPHALIRVVRAIYVAKAGQTSLNHAAKWKSIYSWMDLSEMPKACKNNGVCNIIPGTPNGNCLEGEISRIRQLCSSTHSRECREKRVRCACLPASGDPQPNLEYYKALPHYYSPLRDELLSCSVDVSVFVYMCVCMFVKILFSLFPSETVLTQLSQFACIWIPQTTWASALMP